MSHRWLLARRTLLSMRLRPVMKLGKPIKIFALPMVITGLMRGGSLCDSPNWFMPLTFRTFEGAAFWPLARAPRDGGGVLFPA